MEVEAGSKSETIAYIIVGSPELEWKVSINHLLLPSLYYRPYIAGVGSRITIVARGNRETYSNHIFSETFSISSFCVIELIELFIVF